MVSTAGRWVPDPTFPLFEAFMAGMRWGVDHPSSASDVAQGINAAIEAAVQGGHEKDAAWMAEFCHGVLAVKETIDRWQTRHEGDNGDNDDEWEEGRRR